MNNYTLYFSIYIFIINIFGILIMKYDKTCAKNNNYRVSEKSLFIIALLLGGVGIYIGMYKFRHKTKHTSFTVGIPLCIIINILSIYFILSKNLLISFVNCFIL